MREDFLHHIWKFSNLNSHIQYARSGQRVEIIHPGWHNHDAGPDFFNARIKIDDLEWAGNVEIHVKSSDWVLHGHSSDRAYDSVILHVVYDDDEPLKLQDSSIPTLQLRGCVDTSSIEKFESLSTTKAFVPCAPLLKDTAIDKVLINNYLYRLYVEKLEVKSGVISSLLMANNGDWEETYYQLIARSMGQGKNRLPFELLAKSLPLKLINKEGWNLTEIEALFLGQAGFLESELNDGYSIKLRGQYLKVQDKHGLESIDTYLWKFSRLRPGNFPTLRIAQLASLIQANAFSMKSLLEINEVEVLFRLFTVQASQYWSNHSKIGRISSHRSTALGNDSIKGILINAVVPILFEYGKRQGLQKIQDRALQLIGSLSPETNSVLSQWKRLGFSTESAATSQALLHLKSAYCDHKKCLSCAIGTTILNKSHGR